MVSPFISGGSKAIFRKREETNSWKSETFLSADNGTEKLCLRERPRFQPRASLSPESLSRPRGMHSSGRVFFASYATHGASQNSLLRSIVRENRYPRGVRGRNGGSDLVDTNAMLEFIFVKIVLRFVREILRMEHNVSRMFAYFWSIGL